MTHLSRRWAGIVWFSGAAVYLTLEAVAACAFRPHYSYLRNFISDLGVPGVHSPLAWLMNVGFCVQGSLFLAGAVAFRRSGLLPACAAANAVGNVVIAFFHSGSVPHAVGAVLAIVGGNATVLAASSIVGGWHRRVSIGLGVFGLLSFVVFVIELGNPTSPLGAVERCSVYSITGWQLLTGARLLSQPPSL
ncbi:DUF998 domain-containing protein [Mycobacterium paraterrae]|uniref:DUF998 domain-containing protein n=1 Tax=Mycobacterium paraterrae TaxID=577492 RepID=A0ABY3VJE7_9MYCO|nr:DUF998 domain-containing protein [Mycobacterium paraterrae]UMB68756.1 DUF998 domain-containing protein [Mycobacterium paraterrae]